MSDNSELADPRADRQDLYGRLTRNRPASHMEDDYYSIDSILSENQVNCCPRGRACHYIHLLHRKYNVPSRSIFLTWVTLMVAMSATYALSRMERIATLPHFCSR